MRVLPQYSAADLGIHSVAPSSRFVSTKVGLCGTAACLKTRVIVADVATEPLWLYEGHRDAGPPVWNSRGMVAADSGEGQSGSRERTPTAPENTTGRTASGLLRACWRTGPRTRGSVARTGPSCARSNTTPYAPAAQTSGDGPST